ncbi:hypothetical protein [Rhodocista pekingensis]|uniref:Phasin domain-containing protein n=1 Tax=Rhodocista pekingensis TaxID=201185 RepID=A0ABW2KTY4_9PROT
MTDTSSHEAAAAALTVLRTAIQRHRAGGKALTQKEWVSACEAAERAVIALGDITTAALDDAAAARAEAQATRDAVAGFRGATDKLVKVMQQQAAAIVTLSDQVADFRRREAVGMALLAAAKSAGAAPAPAGPVAASPGATVTPFPARQ